MRYSAEKFRAAKAWFLTGCLVMGLTMAIGLMEYVNDQPVHAQTRAGSVFFTCSVDNIGATLTLCQSAPVLNQRLYITDIVAQSTTATAGLMLLQTGTAQAIGGTANCGTGTLSLYPSSAAVPRIAYNANTGPPTVVSLQMPIVVTQNKDLCVIGTAVNTVTLQITGYVAP